MLNYFFVCLHKTPTLRHRICFFPNLQAKKHTFSHQPSFPSGRKSQPFFRVVKPTKEATKLAFIFLCRNTSRNWCHCLQDVETLELQSNWPRKTPIGKIWENTGKKSTKNNSFPAFKSCGCWNLCQVVLQIQFNGSGRSPGQLEENSDFESSLFRMKFEKSVKSLAFLGPRNSSTSSCLISNELRSSWLISCDCRLTTSW